MQVEIDLIWAVKAVSIVKTSELQNTCSLEGSGFNSCQDQALALIVQFSELDRIQRVHFDARIFSVLVIHLLELLPSLWAARKGINDVHELLHVVRSHRLADIIGDSLSRSTVNEAGRDEAVLFLLLLLLEGSIFKPVADLENLFQVTAVDSTCNRPTLTVLGPRIRGRSTQKISL